MEDWLVDDYLVLGLFPVQNWMLLAMAIVIVGVMISAWRTRP